MMNGRRMGAFARRVMLDIVRDKLTVIFGLGFPVAVMTLLSVIQKNIPVDMFEIEHLTPGIAVFGLSFAALFSGMLIARDRSTSLLLRLRSSPMTAAEYLMGYFLPILPIAAGQCAVCFLYARVWGLAFSWNELASLVSLIPAMVLFIALGMVCGLVFSDRQVGSVCGALLTNLTAWLGGIWFDTSLLGSAFGKVARALPFVHAVEAGRFALAGDFAAAGMPMLIVAAYAAALLALAAALMRRTLEN